MFDFEQLYNDNLVYSWDVFYRPIPGLTLYGEAAANDTEIQADADDPATRSDLDGYALKLKAVGDEDPSRVSIEYERISPEFDNPVGSVTPDREKVRFRWRYKYTEDVHLQTNMLWYQDDLDNVDGEEQTDYYRPELAVAWLRPFDRRYGSARLSFNKKITEQGNNKVRDDDLIYLNYRDRFGRLDMDTNVGYNLYENGGGVDSESNEFLFNTVLRSRLSTDTLVFKPALYLGGWNYYDEIDETDDQFYEYSVGLGIDVPRFKLTSNMKIGYNRLSREGDDDSTKAFGNAGVYWRPGFLASLNDGVLYLQGHINDFEFDAQSEDFREESITAGLSLQY